jgi:hypothetical protein
MTFAALEQVRAAAQDLRQSPRKPDAQLLREARATSRDTFDIFLSHASRDKEVVLGAKALIERRGFTAYVDWIDDAELDRGAVDRERADHRRRGMSQCGSLFYAHASGAISPWPSLLLRRVLADGAIYASVTSERRSPGVAVCI